MSNGEKVVGNILITKTKEDYLNELEEFLYRERFFVIHQLGIVIQTKYITHFKVEEEEVE